MKDYIKSPFNYIGNKYKLLSQILPLFPKEIDTFYDIFCGGLDISVNIQANKIIANDINYFLIEIFEEIKNTEIEKFIKKIKEIIKIHNLSKENKETYYKFRDYYNNNKSPLLLYVLMCFSFNYQFRFNSNMDFNNPAGTNRSSFNESLEKRLYSFKEKIEKIELLSKDYKKLKIENLGTKDFVYLDPPYRTSTGSYNDGNRGFKGWDLKDDMELFNFIDELNSNRIKFALSNVFHNNGLENKELTKWSKKYNINILDISYNNSNYQRNKEHKTREVLITNY